MNKSFENSSQVRVQHIAKAMGGEFVYMCYPQKNFSKDDVLELFKEAHQEVLRIESKYSEFKESVITAINKNAYNAPVEIDEETYNLLKISLDFSIKTDGFFDISFASLSIPKRKAKSHKQELNKNDEKRLASLINYKNIYLNPKKSEVSFLKDEMQISLGGIGKGYAVDKAFEFLKKKGITNFSVNGSGDLRVHSSPDAPRPWRLGIRNPFAKDPTQAAGVVQLQNGSLVSSGIYVQGEHIIQSINHEDRDLVAVTIIADDTMTADVYATTLMNHQSAKAIDFLNKEQLIGLTIDKNGKTSLSKRGIEHFGI